MPQIAQQEEEMPVYCFAKRVAAICFAIVLSIFGAHHSFAFDTKARAAWVYDVPSQTVLLDKNANQPLPPASMSKLMTLYMLFDALKEQRVTLDTTFAVSPAAQAMGGSTMFLQTGDRPSVKELIYGIIVNSGNDACVVVAEGLAGSEQTFAKLMTQQAKLLGMNETSLVNSSGWPDPQHRMSVQDLGILAMRILQDFPEYYSFFSERSFDYKGRSPANAANRNPLLYLDIGADGFKTGHTSEAGYGLVGSAVRGGDRRVILVITGLDSASERSQEAERLLNWSFNQFTQKTYAKANEVLAQAQVWMGAQDSVGLVLDQNLTLLVPSILNTPVTSEVRYKGPINAPVKKGDKIAELVVSIADFAPKHIPLYAQQDVVKAEPVKRLFDKIKLLYKNNILRIQQ